MNFILKIKNHIHFNRKKGVALLMVMGAMSILTAVMVQFIAETQTNKFKVTHQQGLFRSRLMADSALTFSMARIKLYQEALNRLAKDSNLKNSIKQSDLDFIWSFPFKYPLPKMSEANIIQRNAIEEFEKNMILDGGFVLEIQNISNLLNINLLRIVGTDSPDKPTETDPSAKTPGNTDTVEKRLMQLLEKRLEEKREKDEEYEAHYGTVTASTLVKELKYYISDKGSYEDPEIAEFEHLYNETTIKHAPMTSLSELYLLRGWKQAHIDLIANEVTVHGNRVIDLNKLTKLTLLTIFPDLSDEQVEQFFKFRNDPEARPDEGELFFSSEDKFREFMTTKHQFMNDQQYDERLKELREAGLDIGISAHLFKVMVQGTYQNEHPYELVAYVLIPAIPIPPPPPKPPQANGQCETDYELDTKLNLCKYNKKGPNGKPLPPSYEYLTPRIVELVSNT